MFSELGRLLFDFFSQNTLILFIKCYWSESNLRPNTAWVIGVILVPVCMGMFLPSEINSNCQWPLKAPAGAVRITAAAALHITAAAALRITAAAAVRITAAGRSS